VYTRTIPNPFNEICNKYIYICEHPSSGVDVLDVKSQTTEYITVYYYIIYILYVYSSDANNLLIINSIFTVFYFCYRSVCNKTSSLYTCLYVQTVRGWFFYAIVLFETCVYTVSW